MVREIAMKHKGILFLTEGHPVDKKGIKIFFFFVHENMHYGYFLSSPSLQESNEYPYPVFFVKI